VDLTLTVVCATGLLVGVVLLFGGSMVRGPRDIILVVLLVFCQFYVLRPVLFVLGLDTPSPDQQFSVNEEASVVTRTVLGMTLFLVVTLAFVAVVRRTGVAGMGPFVRTRRVDLNRALAVSVLLAAAGTALSLTLIAQFGGIGGVVSAAKVDQALAGLFALRAVPAVGAVVGMATYLEARAQRAPSSVTTIALICAVLNAASVFLWGSRSLLVVVAATLVLGLRRRGARNVTWRPIHAIRWQILLRLTAAALLVIAIAGGLRMVRDTLITGAVQEVYSQASPARQVSLGINATYFDAAMLAMRDWPDKYELRHGEDFRTGVLGLVPRLVWDDKPEVIAPGRWFRQVYEPEKVNGWPMGAGGLWYLNFGWPGIVLGGMLSGLALGVVSAAQLRSPDSGFNTGIAVAVGVYVLGLGIDSDFLVRCILWLLPLWVIARFVTPRGDPRLPEVTDGPLETVGAPTR
jgi:hypothetical protein